VGRDAQERQDEPAWVGATGGGWSEDDDAAQRVMASTDDEASPPADCRKRGIDFDNSQVADWANDELALFDEGGQPAGVGCGGRKRVRDKEDDARSSKRPGVDYDRWREEHGDCQRPYLSSSSSEADDDDDGGDSDTPNLLDNKE
jgi:hypothetical protein